MNSTVIAELQKATRLHGIFTRVAAQLGLSVQHVREVGVGRRKSPRVMKAIAAEYRRLTAGDKAA